MTSSLELDGNLSERPHILVVDDDSRICQLVSRYLMAQSFIVITAGDAQQAREAMKRFVFDALIVDVMMPGQTGLEFTRDLRKSSRIPVILLTALGEVEDRIAGLETGADDYLPKPFEPRELVLRLNAVLRRAPARAQKSAQYQIGAWSFRPERSELEGEQGIQRLTTVETTLLKVLCENAAQPLSRHDLALRCGMDSAGERTIDVQVTRLRRKIEADTRNPRHLLTIRGKGYMLHADKKD
ncbi:MAG: response regulator [Alphaproteobacteria bacterium]|nr:response regulator [Alphaproteobacteria bacterium]MBP7758915.1 response regulator [Alphaproteobacteria bacterium]MBP7762189.1 response regulator [Alphaproteobacteria bacterium]MBP7905308.1 response regulator [Alphaproteobacteria bacterium]